MKFETNQAIAGIADSKVRMVIQSQSYFGEKMVPIRLQTLSEVIRILN